MEEKHETRSETTAISGITPVMTSPKASLIDALFPVRARPWRKSIYTSVRVSKSPAIEVTGDPGPESPTTAVAEPVADATQQLAVRDERTESDERARQSALMAAAGTRVIW